MCFVRKGGTKGVITKMSPDHPHGKLKSDNKTIITRGKDSKE